MSAHSWQLAKFAMSVVIRAASNSCISASINTAMKGVVSEQTRRKEDDCDDEFKGSPEEASRGTLQAGSARVRWSKGDDRIRSTSSRHSRKDRTFEGASIS